MDQNASVSEGYNENNIMVENIVISRSLVLFTSELCKFVLWCTAVPNIKKHIFRSGAQVSFEFYDHLRYLQILYSTFNTFTNMD